MNTIINIIINVISITIISNTVLYAQQSSTVCGLISKPDPACTHHVHDNNLNLPLFLTDYVVQSEVSIIFDCANNIEKIRCSGVILNNNINANDNELLILTARHCLHKNSNVEDLLKLNINAGLGPQVDLSSSAIIFNVNKPNPNNSYNPFNYDKFYVNASLELIEESLVGDIALLKANVDLPTHFNVYYAGWTAESQIDISSNEKHYNISNPKGSPKKVATLRESVLESFQVGWFKANLEEGVLYGGSSGSPFYNEEFKVYGVLSGGEDV